MIFDTFKMSIAKTHCINILIIISNLMVRYEFHGFNDLRHPLISIVSFDV